MDTNFTAKEKVLVHLLDHYGNEEGYVLPVELTQEGIAKQLGLKQNTVSYAVRKLVEEGSLREETRRIKNKKQKRKAYFLTDKGFKEAKDTREKMVNTEVDISSEKEKSLIKLGEINAYFQTNFSLLDIIQRIEKYGSFELKEEKLTDSFESHLKDLPLAVEKEHPKFEELMEIWEKGNDLISVIGEEGSGKTIILSKLTDRIRESNNVFYFDVRSHHDPMQLWTELAEFLENCGQHKLSSYLKSAKKLERKERLNHFLEDIEEKKMVFIFDDIHTNENLSDIIEDMISLKEKTDHSRFVISRKIDHPDLSFEEDKVMLNSTDIFLNVLRDFYSQGIDSLENVLNDHLTEEEYLALALLSTFREPVNRKALSRLEPVTSKMVENLIDTPLVDITKVEKNIYVHPLIKKEIAPHLTSREERWLHEIASDHYIDEPSRGEEHTIEKLYHLLKAKKYEAFEECMNDEGKYLLARGYYDTLIEMIDEFEGYNQDLSVIFIKAEAYRKKNLHQKALGTYKKIIESDEDPFLVAKAYMGSASTKEEQNDYEGAFSEYEEAIE
ncbi:MAG: AAA family ATPase, partial [Candidatus Thermoplasmatota archaeon]|nr:AAA family ATPase [Candidatus Thermoplasmatota archaeon]